LDDQASSPAEIAVESGPKIQVGEQLKESYVKEEEKGLGEDAMIKDMDGQAINGP
jgi:hypothetical protein